MTQQEEMNKRFDERFYNVIRAEEDERGFMKPKPPSDCRHEIKAFIQSEIDLAVNRERNRIWGEMCSFAEPDERQFGAGEIATHLDDVHKIIYPL